MARTKAKLVRAKRFVDVTDAEGNVTAVHSGYEMVTQKVPFTEEEEAARDAEEAVWEAGKDGRERDQLIETEVQQLQQEERTSLRQRAEQRLTQRGEIT